MFDKLRLFLLRREIKKHRRNVAFVSWSNVRSVLLVFDVDKESDVNIVRLFADSLRKEGKRIRLCGFVNQRRISVTSTKDNMFFSRKDVGFWGRPPQELLTHDIKFDIVMDLTLTDVLPLMYVLVNADARLCCGLNKHSVVNIHDFMIELPVNGNRVDSQCRLGKEIVSYLNRIEGV